MLLQIFSKASFFSPPSLETLLATTDPHSVAPENQEKSKPLEISSSGSQSVDCILKGRRSFPLLKNNYRILLLRQKDGWQNISFFEAGMSLSCQC